MAKTAAVRVQEAKPKKGRVLKKPGPTKNVGSGNWVKMAGGIEQALDRMRTMWDLLNALKTYHAGLGCICAVPRPGYDPNWDPLLRETEACANILKSALKARVYER